jgi:hypothetical protein
MAGRRTTSTTTTTSTSKRTALIYTIVSPMVLRMSGC